MNDTNKIEFKKPALSHLINCYTVVDLHFHTKYSDGINTPDQIAKRAEELGIGIAITDHNDIRGAVEFSRIKEILSIPGIEVTSREGTHILVYFYDIKGLKSFYLKNVKPFMGSDIMSSTSLSPEEIIMGARNYKSVIIFPHPYSTVYTGVKSMHFSEKRQEDLLNMADGVEVINSGNLKKWNLKSAVLGFNLNKSITGGSDGHMLKHLGNAVTYADCGKSRKSFLDAVKSKETKVMGKEIHILRKFTSNGRKLKTNFRNYPNLMEKNLKYSYTVLNQKSKKLKKSVSRSLNGKFKKSA